MPTPDELKGAEARTRNDAYLRFLDKRIPELHAEGKRKRPLSAKATVGERMERLLDNVRNATVPGRAAREQADREWAEIRAASQSER